MYTFRHEYLYKLRRHYREFLFFFTFMYIRRFLQDRIFTGKNSYFLILKHINFLGVKGCNIS